MSLPRAAHEPFLLLAAAAVDGRLSVEEATELENHLAGCPSCRLAQRGMITDHRWLAQPGPVPLPHPRVEAAILRAARARGRSVARPFASLVAAGVVIAVALAGWLAWRGELGGLVVGGPPSVSAPVASCVPAPSGLAAWWTGDADGVDVVGGHDAMPRNGLRFAPALVGSAFTLDGVDDFAEVLAPAGLQVGTGDFTVQLWVRFESTHFEQVLVEQWRDKFGNDPPVEGWTLTKLANDGLRLAVETGEPFGMTADSPPDAIDAGRWTHVTARRAGSRFEVLVDGVVVATATTPTRAFIGSPTSIKLGRRGDDNGFFLKGQLDEVQLVIGRAMSDAEIQAVVEAAVAGTCRS